MSHGCMRSMAKHLIQDRFNEHRRTLKIFHCECMIDCFGNKSMAFEPGTCTLMQGWWQVRISLGKAKAQCLCEEVMVAIPGALIVQRQQKEIGQFKLLQHGLAVVLANDSITERPIQTVKYGSLQQERADMLRLLMEYFFRQVIYDVAMASGEGRNKTGRIGAALHG